MLPCLQSIEAVVSLRKFPPLFVTLTASAQGWNDEPASKLACYVNDRAIKLCFLLVDTKNVTYEAEFGEPELKIVKGVTMGWKAFFSGVETALIQKAVSITQQSEAAVTLQFQWEPAAKATFLLPKSVASSGTLRYLHRLYSFYEVRHDTSATEKMVDEWILKSNECQETLVALEQEKRALTHTIAQLKEEKAQWEQEYIQLQQELCQMLPHNEPHEHMSQPRAGVEHDMAVELDDICPMLPDDRSVSFARIPLGPNSTCREYDRTLLQLIKSKVQPAEAEGETTPTDPLERTQDKHLSVIRPLTSSQLTAQLQSLPFSATSLVMSVMENLQEWNYDVWTLQDFSKKGALFYTGYAIYYRWNLPQLFQIDEAVLINFLSQVEAGYHPNPFHNSMHSADVAQALHYILDKGGLKAQCRLSEEDVFAAITAALIVDYDHPGQPNRYHIMAQTYLATLYNDRYILQNHSCAEVFELMRFPSFNILASFSEQQRRNIRETIIAMVLYTSNGLNQFREYRKRTSECTEFPDTKEDQQMAFKVFFEVAVISNISRPLNIHVKWACKFIEEWTLKGDDERNRGFGVGPFGDRSTPEAKMHLSFMNFVTIPMFECVSELFPEMQFLVSYCQSNKEYWLKVMTDCISQRKDEKNGKEES